MQPTECKYCGCEEVATKTDSEIVFRCWSSYVIQDDYWTVSGNCAVRCAVQLVEMRERVQQADQDIEIVKARLRTLNERVQRAVESLEGAARFDVIPWDGGIRRDPAVDGWETDSGILDQVIEILKGNIPESSNSSQITTDDLAVADYYEAVRQRVPWMVSVEHIEGLVEGYRRCGVMVWQTAEEIRKVHGGGQ